MIRIMQNELARFRKADVLGNPDEKPPRCQVDKSTIPDLLRKNDRWVGWQWQWNGTKWDKPPVDLRTGGRISIADPANWRSFEEALAAYQSGKVDGVGFVLGELESGEHVSGIDLDDCRNVTTDELSETAREVIANLDTYCEVSPSGTGVKLLCRGELPAAAPTRTATGQMEIYSHGRYFTITGQHVAGSPHQIEARQEELIDIHDEYIGSQSSRRASKSVTARRTTRASKHALKAMLKIKPRADERDGSKRLLAVCCRAVEHDLDDSCALATIRKYEAKYPFPRTYSDQQIFQRLRDAERRVQRGSKLIPIVELPGGSQTVSQAGAELGVLLSEQGKHYRRGDVIVRMTAEGRLQPIDGRELSSDFELVARLVRITESKGKRTKKQATCSVATASQIMASEAFKDALPSINLITQCPVLIERGGELLIISGYDRESGILAMGERPQEMSIDEARQAVEELLAGFRFATDGDKARAVAALITPALAMGSHIPGRIPIDLGEADQSQSGKGYRNKLTAAVYKDVPTTVNQRKGGVGSLEETFDRALVSGRVFINLDNVRGCLDSSCIESFLTEDTYLARCAYSRNVHIDPKRHVVMLTSNQASMTTDLANRASCVRILKQPEGHVYLQYPEGDLLAHVRAHQPRYLGAVFAIIKEWHARGNPTSAVTQHDFRAWAQTLDAIVHDLLGYAPLLRGHQEVQQRMANPARNWLREVVLAAVQEGRQGEWLLASDLLEIMQTDSGIEIPGLKEDADIDCEGVRENVLRQIGRKLKQAFRSDSAVVIDTLRIEHDEYKDEGSRDRNRYRVSSIT